MRIKALTTKPNTVDDGGGNPFENPFAGQDVATDNASFKAETNTQTNNAIKTPENSEWEGPGDSPQKIYNRKTVSPKKMTQTLST